MGIPLNVLIVVFDRPPGHPNPSIVHQFRRSRPQRPAPIEARAGALPALGIAIVRTAFAGATTGQQLLYALDEQVRRFEVEGLVTKHELYDLAGLVLDEGEGPTGENAAGELVALLRETAGYPREHLSGRRGGASGRRGRDR